MYTRKTKQGKMIYLGLDKDDKEIQKKQIPAPNYHVK